MQCFVSKPYLVFEIDFANVVVVSRYPPLKLSAFFFGKLLFFASQVAAVAQQPSLSLNHICDGPNATASLLVRVEERSGSMADQTKLLAVPTSSPLLLIAFMSSTWFLMIPCCLKYQGNASDVFLKPHEGRFSLNRSQTLHVGKS